MQSVVEQLDQHKDGTTLTIAQADEILGDAHLGDSISVNGIVRSVSIINDGVLLLCYSPGFPHQAPA